LTYGLLRPMGKIAMLITLSKIALAAAAGVAMLWAL
jgi:hypothetical protein